ncbi:MAG TPA: ISAs1 family transposase, partial [Rhizomicrobium sp.]|nr:ISAs1 family transposase [Rhizomicrobium sp.]HTT85419.1 ISAs1 family transposase [Rhizomicrobium sp.]
LAILRRLALNLLRAHPDPISMRRKMNAAAWDDTFLISLLGQKR